MVYDTIAVLGITKSLLYNHNIVGPFELLIYLKHSAYLKPALNLFCHTLNIPDAKPKPKPT